MDKKEPDECWLWQGTRDDNSYGRLSFQCETYVASRISLLIATGEMPKGMLACHHCDTPPCVNPNHLYWGTSSENARDAVIRGRTKACQVEFWTRNIAVCLTPENAAYLRRLQRFDPECPISTNKLINGFLNLMREFEIKHWRMVWYTWSKIRRERYKGQAPIMVAAEKEAARIEASLG